VRTSTTKETYTCTVKCKSNRRDCVRHVRSRVRLPASRLHPIVIARTVGTPAVCTTSLTSRLHKNDGHPIFSLTRTRAKSLSYYNITYVYMPTVRVRVHVRDRTACTGQTSKRKYSVPP
jgi:hypothetical protein